MPRKVKSVKYHSQSYEFSERTLWKFYSSIRDNPELEPERALATAMGCSETKDAVKFLKQAFGEPTYKGVLWELMKQDPYR